MELVRCASSFCLPYPRLFNLQNPALSSAGFPVAQNRINLGSDSGSGRGKGFVVEAREKGAEAETLVIEKPTKKVQRFEVSEGYPAPFGATLVDGGVNFAIFSGNAVSATLCLIGLSDLQKELQFAENCRSGGRRHKPEPDIKHMAIQ